jgi:hypothetical protein
LDYSVTGAQQITLSFRNTSPDNAFTDGGAPAAMLLTGFGLQLGRDILNGTVSVGSGATALNFESGQSVTNISNRYNYANEPISFYNQPGVFAVDIVVSSVEGGGAAHNFTGSDIINGPDYGAISTNETQFGTSQPGVSDFITVVLNLDGAAPSFSTVNNGNVILAFGSPTALAQNVPDAGTTLALFGLSMSTLAYARRRFSKRTAA